MEKSKLIILRGNSGSGKSSVATALHQAFPGRSALIEQDHYKERMIRPKDALGKRAMRELLLLDAQHVLGMGYSVIIDGIFHNETYAGYFDSLFERHPDNNHMFYFDISYQETLRRHAMREKAKQFGHEVMQTWFREMKPMGYDFERRIGEDMSLQEVIEYIRKEAGIDDVSTDESISN